MRLTALVAGLLISCGKSGAKPPLVLSASVSTHADPNSSSHTDPIVAVTITAQPEVYIGSKMTIMGGKEVSDSCMTHEKTTCVIEVHKSDLRNPEGETPIELMAWYESNPKEVVTLTYGIKPGPDAVAFEYNPYGVTCVGVRCNWRVKDAELTFGIDKTTDDITLVLDGQRFTGKGSVDAHVSLWPRVRATTLAEARVGGTYKIPFEITVGKVNYKGNLEREIKELTELYNASVDKLGKGPGTLGPDEPASDHRHVLFAFGTNQGISSLPEANAGTDTKLSEIDLVPTSTTTSTHSACPTYTTDKGESLQVTGTHWLKTVTVYERRTGKEVGKKTFAGKGRICAEQLETRDGRWYTSDTVDDKEVTAWAMTLVK